MPKPSKIPENQLARVYRLEKLFEEALNSGNLTKAKIALNDLKEILERFHHNARILQAYLKLYETALEAWDIELAKRGFQFVREKANKRTRLYLEATTLLAITHLRDQDIFSAEPLMAEVLKNDTIIKSEEQRRIFRKEIIVRFDQEGALSSLAKSHPEVIREAQIHQDAIRLLRQGLSDEELEENLGQKIPQEVKDFILKVDMLSKNVLPYTQRLMLPSPKDVIKNRQVASLVFNAIKRRLFVYICDEDSESYQAWINGGLDAIVSKSYVASAVVAALADLRIGVSAVAVGVTALLIKKGLENFCNNYKPKSLMILRKRGS